MSGIAHVRENAEVNPSLVPNVRNVKSFATPRALNTWLARHHAASQGLWIRFYKKASGVRSITYSEAVDEALCWGWIDGQARPNDAESWLQRFSPRRPRSKWSKRNCDRVERLEREGRMQPAGRAQVEAATADGRWAAAYDPPSEAEVPADFLKALSRDRKAAAFFETLNRANVFAIVHRLQTAVKPETRLRRIERFVQMMRAGEKLH